MALSSFLKITIDGESLAISKRAINRITKAALYASGRFWDQTYLHTHFLPSAGARYGYAFRSKSTLARKKKLAAAGLVQKGGAVALVHTGLTENAMKRRHVVKGFPTRATVYLPTPTYITARPRGRKINMADEILRVIPREVSAINAVAEKVTDEETRHEVANNRYKKVIS